MNEREITARHLEDLARRAYERAYPVFSEFLNTDEISTLLSLPLPCPYTLYGGCDNAERCVAGFGDVTAFPIVCLKIQPVAEKFADRLTHRDFLGSLMNLGISRSTLGDIRVKDNTGYLFCLESMADYICENLTKIKHTTVRCETADAVPDFITELPDETPLHTPSLRADAVIAAVYKLSRSETARLFAQEKVFINARSAHKDSVLLKAHDTVSVRGHGRFIFEGEIRKTKKDRAVVSVRIYK